MIEKGGGAGKGKLIAIIAAAVLILGGGGAALLLGGKKDKPEKEPVAVEEPVVEEPAVVEPVVEEPVVEEPAPEAPKPASKPAANPTSYNLGWGTYEGPMQGGKPHGMGGEIKVNKDYQIDMKNGSFKSVSKGDKIVSCKFNAGKLVQGYIHHANGQQESLYIGN